MKYTLLCLMLLNNAAIFSSCRGDHSDPRCETRSPSPEPQRPATPDPEKSK